MKNVNGGVLFLEVLITLFFIVPQVNAAEESVSNSESILTSGTSIEVSSGTSITIEGDEPYSETDTEEITSDTSTETEKNISATTEDIAEITSEMDTEVISEDFTEEETTFTKDVVYREDKDLYKITGYCGCLECCGKTDCITASGKRAKAGRTIAMDPSIPFGTRVLINGDEYIVEDRGGAIKGNRIDIFFDSHQEGDNWGVQYLPVKILD